MAEKKEIERTNRFKAHVKLWFDDDHFGFDESTRLSAVVCQNFLLFLFAVGVLQSSALW